MEGGEKVDEAAARAEQRGGQGEQRLHHREDVREHLLRAVVREEALRARAQHLTAVMNPIYIFLISCCVTALLHIVAPNSCVE